MTLADEAHQNTGRLRPLACAGQPFEIPPQRRQRAERDPGMPSSTWRLRSDAWEYLRFGVKRIALGSDEERAQTRDSEIGRNLRALETLEMYWAGFGQRYVQGIADQLRCW